MEKKPQQPQGGSSKNKYLFGTQLHSGCDGVKKCMAIHGPGSLVCSLPALFCLPDWHQAAGSPPPKLPLIAVESI